MRHGRKSKFKAFSGYKRHLTTDADVSGLIVAVEVLPANRPEREAAAPLLDRLGERFDVVQVQIDRGYLTAECIVTLHDNGVDVISKPPFQPKGARYGKADFDVDFEARRVTCPMGASAPIQTTGLAQFPRATCMACVARTACLTEANLRGRSVRMHPQESWYREMARELGTPEGRAKRRERTAVEHSLARVGTIQGTRARYRGTVKNQAHLEIVGAVNNSYVLGSLLAEAA